MQISDKQIEKFQKLWKKEFGKEIEKGKAREEALKLIRLVELVYKPIKKSDLERYGK